MVLLCSPSCGAQEKPYLLSCTGTFTLSSRLFVQPDAREMLLRSQHLALNNIFGFGLDLRRWLDEGSLQIGVSAEYISRIHSFSVIVNGRSVPVSDGYAAVPVEASGYFTIPFSSESVQMHAGGGVGLYFGSRKYYKDGIAAESIDGKPGFGIHVVSGVDVSLWRGVWARGEMKFRSVQYTVTNSFPANSGARSNSITEAERRPFSSRVDIDGMNVVLGLAVGF